MTIRVAVLTVSDRCFGGEAIDESGPEIVRWVAAAGWSLAGQRIVPDEVELIAGAMTGWADREVADVVITTGGTGIAARDRTPEATMMVIERTVPGIAEALRQRGAAETPNAMLGRGVAGVRRRTLVVNLPGSPAGVRDGLTVLRPVLEHAVRQLRGITEH